MSLKCKHANRDILKTCETDKHSSGRSGNLPQTNFSNSCYGKMKMGKKSETITAYWCGFLEVLLGNFLIILPLLFP